MVMPRRPWEVRLAPGLFLANRIFRGKQVLKPAFPNVPVKVNSEIQFKADHAFFSNRLMDSPALIDRKPTKKLFKQPLSSFYKGFDNAQTN